MNSPSATARFNFGANDAEFLGNRDTGNFSFGQPFNSNIRSSQNPQLPSPIVSSYASFGNPGTNFRTNQNIANVRNTDMVSRSSIPIVSITPPKYNPVQVQHNPKFALPAPPQGAIRTTMTTTTPMPAPPTNQKMNIIYRPQVHSVNMGNVGSLQTITQQKSSNPNIRSTQGYNTSQMLRQQQERKLQQDAKCCFFFSRKKNN